ncbi:MAG: arginyltransferase [Planctomycetaceae bacterium]|nr:arginyltransferase [Planctomycetaceae bacterium]
MTISLPVVDLYRGFAPPHACSYLPSETTRFEYRLPTSLSGEQWQELLRRGWRRHGVNFFRPACPHCTQCRSLRVDVTRFRPGKSQRRAMKRNADVEVELHPASVTRDHIRLYNDYHADMSERRGWPHRSTDRNEYSSGFLAGDWPFAFELRYLRGTRLIGVGLIDIVPEGLSSIYFYHDPEWRPQGPGTFSVQKEFEAARSFGGRYVYLGYWIADCQSMAYKCQFRPHELLDRNVADHELPQWREVEASDGTDDAGDPS